MLNILVACEESQAVTNQLRLLGHNAFSCDIKSTSGCHPEWHICDNVLKYINLSWDIIIAFPPCTYLTNAGNRHLNSPGRKELRSAAVQFFMSFVNAPCAHIAIENPVGCMNTIYRKPDQVINPYLFGDNQRKRTCLWLKNLPLLVPDYQLPPPEPIYIQSNGKKRYFVDTCNQGDRQTLRSKTFPGVARAMAYQFTNNFYIDDCSNHVISLPF